MGQEIQQYAVALHDRSRPPLTLIIPGDILHASAFGNHVVVINSLKMAEEIFERRAKLYNDRPVIPIVKVYVFAFY